uniref:Uncharacterized protein n=1 Tax=Alexandrium catenella TaxID=2925 RepID=A0A7S1WUE7_ALECA|mmetsp:Transcript_92248/g.245099  ORF Transcript_92248/g.245099 Transcript_92248/m.245099 type:complete len:104 (+) Transcript_92248:1-312(+)
MAGMNRPIVPATVIDPSKRPRITPPMQTVRGVTPPVRTFTAPGAKAMQVRPMTPRTVLQRPMTPGVRPPGQQGTPRPAIRPVTPAAKAQEKPGNLIRSLLQKL